MSEPSDLGLETQNQSKLLQSSADMVTLIKFSEFLCSIGGGREKILQDTVKINLEGRDPFCRFEATCLFFFFLYQFLWKTMENMIFRNAEGL